VDDAVSGPLDAKVVVVTGGGAGIGRAVSIACGDAGAAVVVAGPGDNAADTVAFMAGRGHRAVFVRTDVTDAAQVDAAVGTAVARFGGLHAVVHNATSRHSSEAEPISSLTDAVWDDHMAVSLRGAYHCARAARPHLERSAGRLILMTSPAAMEGSETRPAYAAAKGAVRGLAKSLAVEWGPLGIGVVCVSPLAHTPALENAYRRNPDLAPRLRRLVPLGRVGDAGRDIAPAVVFLVGEGGRYITGQTIVVDGGRFMTL
jgi:3-oxoacyl-[acyl-carrier protein] reductase